MSKHHHKHTEETGEELEQTEQETPEITEPEETPAQETKPDYYEQFVRLSADFENFRKRTEREKAAFLSYGKKELAEKLLPSYEILLKQNEELNKNDALKKAPNELKNVVSGIQLLLTEMQKAFRSEGIEKMDVLNKPYDPATQEVVAMIPADEKQDGLVLQEVQMGFMLDGKVLRPARVIVGQHNEK
ncbi:nucleotide exchange factor GrpE [Candidatus Avelusimicrobium caledoniensis]|uniref:nucleotide exchange factor GrpE n=1 Tax=Candidatus Avelusimicrobium caledoniensis TaxID=3416220 RepID=UPI003D0A6E6A